MSTHFVPADRAQQYLFPPSIQDWLPESHMARFIVDIVSQLDLRELSATYAGKEVKAYHPSMLVALLFYGYATGVFSSRKLEQATYDSIAFRYYYRQQPPRPRYHCRLPQAISRTSQTALSNSHCSLNP